MAMSTALGDYDLFFTAYTLDDVEDPATRPVTFAYNGGPGAASAYVNLGLLGPDHLSLDADGMVQKVPTGYEPNEYSLLDVTDLVFIDPVGTGFSRAAADTDPNVFYSYDTDIQSVGDFIIQYVNRNQRWASPKYLAGESYGATRTAGLCAYLLDICGYYDQATPFFAAEWTCNHLFLNDDLKDNLSFTYYPSGHMFYQHEPSLRQFRADAEAWYGQ